MHIGGKSLTLSWRTVWKPLVCSPIPPFSTFFFPAFILSPYTHSSTLHCLPYSPLFCIHILLLFFSFSLSSFHSLLRLTLILHIFIVLLLSMFKTMCACAAIIVYALHFVIWTVHNIILLSVAYSSLSVHVIYAYDMCEQSRLNSSGLLVESKAVSALVLSPHPRLVVFTKAVFVLPCRVPVRNWGKVGWGGGEFACLVV